MTKRTTRVKRTSIVMPMDVYKKGVEMAEADRRTFNNYVVVLVERAIASKIDVSQSPAASETEVVG